MKLLKVFLVQMTSTDNIHENMDLLVEYFLAAKQSSADIVVLPEMFAQFGSSDARKLAELEGDFNGPVGRGIRQLAVEYKMWIVAGTVPVLTSEDENPRARCHVIDDQGQVVSHYDKIHLFDAVVGDKQGRYAESDHYQAGHQAVVFDSPWGRIGLAVCYDLRFPELFRRLNDMDASMVIVPAAFTYKTGSAHWDVLCRARAIENGYFIAAANQCGDHDEKRSTWGHSMVVNPWGEIQSLAHQPKGLSVAIDFNLVEAVRTQIPVNQNRQSIRNSTD